jgi:hypothetical protein
LKVLKIFLINVLQFIKDFISHTFVDSRAQTALFSNHRRHFLVRPLVSLTTRRLLVRPNGAVRAGRLVTFLFFGITSFDSAMADDYHLVMKYHLGGLGTYDYITVDEMARRLYVTDFARVIVLDLDRRNVLGEISGMHLAQGVAVVNELGRGFISDGPADRVVVFDLQTFKILGEIKTEGKPDCILYDKASRHVFSFNGRGKSSSAIDPAEGKVLATIPLGGKPEFAVADDAGTIYVNNQETSEVVVLDSRALKVKARWPVAPASAPTSIAMDRQHRRLFIGARNKRLVVMNADNGKIVASLPIGGMVDAGAYEPETKLVFTSTGEGILHIFREDSPDKYSVVQTVLTQPGARTMGLDPRTHNLFLTTADFGPPPPPTAENANPQPTILQGSFVLLVYGR